MRDLALLAGLGPEPVPSPPAAVDPNDVTPGLAGFLALLFLALAVIVLGRSLVRRVRRIRYRAELEEREAAAGRAGRADHQAGRPGGAREDQEGSGGRRPSDGPAG